MVIEKQGLPNEFTAGEIGDIYVDTSTGYKFKLVSIGRVNSQAYYNWLPMLTEKSNVEDIDQLSDEITNIAVEYLNVKNESYINCELTETYGYVNEYGKISDAGNASYNYTIINVLKGQKFLINSAKYKLILPYVFVGVDGKRIPYPAVTDKTDSTVYEIKTLFTAPLDGILYVNYYKIPISVADISDHTKFNTIKTDKLEEPVKQAIQKADYNGNILYGKKWAVCGDSFSNGDFSNADDIDYVIDKGLYKGKNKVYGYLIGNRNNMIIQHLAAGGRTIATPSDGSFTNAFSNELYKSIDDDVDYITMYFGINDSHHRPLSTGSDGEDQTGTIEIGTIDDIDNTTFYGAWNVVLSYLIENYPYAHIGIIVSNGCETDEYRLATIAIAKKWGIPYIDLNGDDRTPVMLRSTNPDISSSVKNSRLEAFRVSSINGHPSAKAHEYESWFIENFLRTL